MIYVQRGSTKGPEKVEVNGVTKETIDLSWGPIPCLHQNGIILHYLVQYSSGFEMEYESQTKDSLPKITLRDHLRPNTAYSVRIAGVNDGGIGEFSSPMTVITRGGMKTEIYPF